MAIASKDECRGEKISSCLTPKGEINKGKLKGSGPILRAKLTPPRYILPICYREAHGRLARIMSSMGGRIFVVS